ncbi:Uncharacterised protein [Nocardia brasiliensis]|nr:Uncharacterised protein [Nocardia brasiliensis]
MSRVVTISPEVFAAASRVNKRSPAKSCLGGIAAGEHTERSLILDLAFALAADRPPM